MPRSFSEGKFKNYINHAVTRVPGPKPIIITNSQSKFLWFTWKFQQNQPPKRCSSISSISSSAVDLTSKLSWWISEIIWITKLWTWRRMLRKTSTLQQLSTLGDIWRSCLSFQLRVVLDNANIGSKFFLRWDASLPFEMPTRFLEPEISSNTAPMLARIIGSSATSWRSAIINQQFLVQIFIQTFAKVVILNSTCRGSGTSGMYPNPFKAERKSFRAN